MQSEANPKAGRHAFRLAWNLWRNAMNREQLWEHYCNRNPQFKRGPVTMSAAGLRKLFDQTWDMAQKHEVVRQVRSTESRPSVPDFFKGIFTSKKP